MRILVYPHDLGPGGSQLNAVELAAGLAKRGHSIVVYGRPGPLLTRIDELGLRFVASPAPSHRPSATVARHLARTCDDLGIDVLHAYEWPPALECHFAARLTGRAEVVTVMSMSVAPFIPRRQPLVVGTEQIARRERRFGRSFVRVVEPPVDLEWNSRSVTPGVDDFRNRWTEPGCLTVVVVGRLVPELKLEGLLSLIDAVGLASLTTPLRLVVVGDGSARAVVQQRADEANAAAGRVCVVLCGHLDDPRAAYACADVAVGMGGSALRALAFGVPLVVQGEQGFFRLLTPDSVAGFLWTGWYGVGDGAQPVAGLAELLAQLAGNPDLRRELGEFGRQLVMARFSLASAAARQESIYREVLELPRDPRRRPTSDDVVAASRFTAQYARRRWQRRRGGVATDDANSTPVARLERTSPPPRPTLQSVDPGAWVWHPGVPWEAIAGTDRRLVTALARHVPVIWVDPPLSPRHLKALTRRLEVPDGVHVIRSAGPLGPDRAVLRGVSDVIARWNTRRAVRQNGAAVDAIVVSSPHRTLPQPDSRIVNIYYETDDFVAGARLLGARVDRAVRGRRENLRRADIVLAVTQYLLDQLPGPPQRQVLPNGVDDSVFSGIVPRGMAPDSFRQGTVRAGLFGQLNDRIDLRVVEALVASGVEVLVVGPVAARTPASTERIRTVLRLPGVNWLGPQPFSALPELMGGVDVGITPYTDSEFNRASFPLKTLEYLAAGLPVVSTRLPSAEALAGADVTLASSAAEFIDAVVRAASSTDATAVCRRKDTAHANNWETRAETLLAARERVLREREAHPPPC